jgi:hypothetical protein
MRVVCLRGRERGRGRQVVWRGLDLVVVPVDVGGDVVEVEVEDVVGCG